MSLLLPPISGRRKCRNLNSNASSTELIAYSEPWDEVENANKVVADTASTGNEKHTILYDRSRKKLVPSLHNRTTLQLLHVRRAEVALMRTFSVLITINLLSGCRL